MTDAPVHRFNAEDFHLLAQSGALGAESRVELLDGQIVDMFPIGPFHGSIIGYLIDHLAAANRGRWISASQSALQLDEFDVPQPDFLLLRLRQHRYVEILPTPGDVFLLVEVADSSPSFDRTKKLPVYAKAEVPEVWIVNVPKKVVEIHHAPCRGKYEEVTVVKPGQSFAPQAFPDVVLRTSEMFNLA